MRVVFWRESHLDKPDFTIFITSSGPRRQAEEYQIRHMMCFFFRYPRQRSFEKAIWAIYIMDISVNYTNNSKSARISDVF